MSEIRILPFGSGSTGNSIYIELSSYRFLIDMGIGFRYIRDALHRYDRELSDVQAIFLTHGHSDHVKSAKAIANHTDCPVYTEKSSMYPIREIDCERISVVPYEQFEPLEGLYVTMFPVPHDYVMTCGFVFETAEYKLSYVTDCGKMNDTILSYLYGSDLVIMESNHDVEMLRNGPYPRQLQNRILSRFGHLSNAECADTIEKLYQYGTKNFMLAHLSLVNNTPEIALKTVLDRMEGKDAKICVCPDHGDEMFIF